MRKIVFVLMSLLLLSCGAAKNVPTASPSVRDSTHVEIREKTVFIHDTLYINVPKQSASNTTNESFSHLETDFAVSDASIDSTGNLRHTLNNKEANVPVPTDTPVHSRDSVVYRDREIEIPKPYPVEVEVPRDLTWWQKTQMIGFWAMILMLALKYRKTLISFIRRFI